MPHLIITRDARVEREVDVDFGTDLRVGRDPENDLVLDDPDRGVSRFHAEIHCDEGGCSIVDLDSRNGTWVDGQRITTMALAAGMKIALGPYILELQLDPAAPSAPTVDSSSYTIFDPGRAAAPDVPHQPEAGAPPPTPATNRMPIAKRRQALLFGGATILVAGLAAIALLRGTATQPSAPRPLPVDRPGDSVQSDVSQRLAEARRLLDSGDAGGAQRELDSVLAIDPTNRDAMTLREKAAALVAPPPPEPPAPEPVSPVNRRPPDRRGTDTPVVDLSLVQRKPDESQADWEARSQRARDHYAAAVAALFADNPRLAISQLELLEREQPGYRDAISLLTRAHDRLRAEAQQALDAGARHEQAGEWQAALREYERAHQLDSALNVTERTTRIREQMTKLGTEALKNAHQLDALGKTSQAIELYERAVALLPADDVQRQEAAKRLQILKSKP